MTTSPVSIPQPDELSIGHLFDQFQAAATEYVTHRLAGFAAKLQRDLEMPLNQAEDFNAAIFLSELCEYWGLSDEQRAQVLGPEAFRYIELLEADHLTLEEVVAAVQTLDIIPEA